MQEAYRRELLGPLSGEEREMKQSGRGGGTSVMPALSGPQSTSQSSQDGRILQSSGLGQEDHTFIPDINQPLGLDGSGRDMSCWEGQFSSAEAVPRRGCAESIRLSILKCDLRHAS